MPTRPMGRPHKGDGPRFPRNLVDSLLVHGESFRREDGRDDVRFPSYREVAQRFGVAPSLIARYAQEHNCLGRRHDGQQLARRLAAHLDPDGATEKLPPLTDDEILDLIDNYLRAFIKSVDEGRTRTDNPSDANLMIRLRHFVKGGPDRRQETYLGITLEDLQARHAVILEQRRIEQEQRERAIDARILAERDAQRAAGLLPDPGADDPESLN